MQKWTGALLPLLLPSCKCIAVLCIMVLEEPLRNTRALPLNTISF